ncbi:hypothetical protein [Halobacillus sp. H74]|uniref:hypothetical protein n=1 Tax=Halobacillus sp. H74 TaxID=3457436 RepID=UPI003FCD25B3
MKKYLKAIDKYFEEVDKRIDNRLTFIGIFSALIAAELLNKPFIDGMILVIIIFLVRGGWDLINPNSRAQQRYRQTSSILLVFITLATIIGFVIKILLPYPYGILY